LFKTSQNRPIIELFKFFRWATTALCGNLDQPKPKTDTKLYKISQNRPIIVDFLIFPGGPWPTPAHEGLRHCLLYNKYITSPLSLPSVPSISRANVHGSISVLAIQIPLVVWDLQQQDIQLLVKGLNMFLAYKYSNFSF